MHIPWFLSILCAPRGNWLTRPADDRHSWNKEESALKRRFYVLRAPDPHTLLTSEDSARRPKNGKLVQMSLLENFKQKTCKLLLEASIFLLNLTLPEWEAGRPYSPWTGQAGRANEQPLAQQRNQPSKSLPTCMEAISLVPVPYCKMKVETGEIPKARGPGRLYTQH